MSITILSLPGFLDFLPNILEYLDIIDILNLVQTCKTCKILIQKQEKLIEKEVVNHIWEKHENITKNLSIHFKDMTKHILDFAISDIINEHDCNLAHFKGIFTLLKEHENDRKQNWFKAFFRPLEKFFVTCEYISILEMTISEFKYLCLLASCETFQKKSAISIPPYFGLIMSNFKKIANHDFNLWLESKIAKEPLHHEFLLKVSEIFLHDLNDCKVMQPLSKKLPKLVRHYKDIVFAMCNINTLFSDSISDTIYYELIRAIIRENPYTKNIYIKFLPLF